MRSLGIIFLILSTHFTSFFSVVYFKVTKDPLAFKLGVLNDLMLMLLGLISISDFKVKFLTKGYGLVISLILFLLTIDMFLLSDADFTFRLMAFRKLISLLLALLIGFNLIKKGNYFNRYLDYHYVLFIPIFLFGLIEYLIDTIFWDRILELPKFWYEKGDLFAATKGTVESAGKFYSYDLYPIIGRKVRRMVSFYTETKPLASYCIFLFPFVYFSNRGIIRLLMFTMVFIVGMLTYSKGFILVILLCIFQKYIKLKPFIIWSMLLAFFFLGSVVNHYSIGFGPLSHVNGLFTGAMIMIKGNLLGLGLGKTGNYISPLEESLGGGESGLGAMLGQVGITALILYFLFYKLSRTLYDRYLASGQNIYYATYICLIGWTANFLYAEASIGFRGNIFVFLTTGLVLAMPIQNQTLENDYNLE